MSFKEYLDESPVGAKGRTSVNDANNHISDDLIKEFNTVIKKMGGKTVARQILGGFKPSKKADLPSDLDSNDGVPEITTEASLKHADMKALADEFEKYVSKKYKTKRTGGNGFTVYVNDGVGRVVFDPTYK